MTTLQVPTVAAARPATTRRAMQTRYRLLILGAVGFVLALLTLLQAVHAYSTTYDLFRGIIDTNSTTVDASENALQDIAQASQAAADYAVLDTSTPLFEQAQTNIFRYFSNFRDELFTLRNNLQTDEERTAFTVADTFTYSSFWRHISNLVSQRSNDTVAQREYLEADNHLLNWINPALQDLESLNFQQMVDAGNQAGSVIYSQVLLLAIPGIALALLLTYLSYTIRKKVHRYLTPGIDIALFLSWVMLIVLLLDLLGAPGQLQVMIQDSYRNVSASSRVLVDANLANRAESSEILDTERASSWETRFDQAMQRVELRLCGQTGCLANSFASSNADQPTQQVVDAAKNISAANSAQIDGIVPLMANITISGEAPLLEQARLALQDFEAADTKLRTLVKAGNTADAITLNTTTGTGTSQEAFDRFVTAMDQVRDMNHSVFDQVGQSMSDELLQNERLLGLAGYALVALLLVVGVYQRYREL